jgi:hypothetical protein
LCNGREVILNQQWRFLDSGNGCYRLTSRRSGSIFDDYQRSIADGTDIFQWSELNGTDRQFG